MVSGNGLAVNRALARSGTNEVVARIIASMIITQVTGRHGFTRVLEMDARG